MKLLGVDFGTRRTGIAISDDLQLFAHALEVIVSSDMNYVAGEVARLAEENRVYRIVVGMPKNMNNSCGERARSTMVFMDVLSGVTEIPAVSFDERLTTVAAQRALQACGTHRKRRKTVVDSVAAAVLLQNYMDFLKNTGC